MPLLRINPSPTQLKSKANLFYKNPVGKFRTYIQYEYFCSITTQGRTTNQRNNPVPVTLASGVTTTAVSAGYYHSLAIGKPPAPPTLQVAFGAASIQASNSTSLSFTVTNPNSFALSGVSFSTGLPAQLVIATPNGLINTCGGTVTATAGGTSVSLSGGTLAANVSCTLTLTVQGTAAGTANLTVNGAGMVSSTQSGTGTAPNTASLTINLNSTTLTLTSSPNPAVLGQSVSFTTTVSPLTATGAVTFSAASAGLSLPSGPINLVNGVATLAITPTVAGTYSITATYRGDSNYNSSSASSALVVNALSGSYCHKLNPFRLYDSRPKGTNPTDPPLGTGAGSLNAGQTRNLGLSGLTSWGLPASGIKAITANLSIVSAGPGVGFVTAFPTTDSFGNVQKAPVTTNLAWFNPGAATILSNFATIGVDKSGSFSVYVGVAAADVIIDVTGYYSSDSSGVGTGIYRSVDSTQKTFRLYDSRAKGTNSVDPPLGAGDGSLAAGKSRTLQVTG